MQIVIDIDDNLYTRLFNNGDEYIADMRRACVSIRKGTPLPKGHGRLIDVKELRQDIIAHKYSIDFCKEHNIDQSINVGMLNILLADALTIIEADMERSDKE